MGHRTGVGPSGYGSGVFGKPPAIKRAKVGGEGGAGNCFPVTANISTRSEGIMRWIIFLFMFIIACSPVAETEQTRAPIPAADKMIKESCMETLQNYFTAEQWRSLRLDGETVCREELYYQTVPLEVRLIMTRVATIRRLRRLETAPPERHCHDRDGNMYPGLIC